MTTALALIADARGILVVSSQGDRQRSQRVSWKQRAGIVRAIAALQSRSRTLQGIIVCVHGVSFAAARVIVSTANALAYATPCAVVRVPARAGISPQQVLRAGRAVLEGAHPRWVIPEYDAPPNISQPHRGVRFHENAGGIVFDPVRNALLFVQRKDNGVMGTPKGHREPGEPLIVTAKREIAEETGIADIEVLATLPSVTYLSDDHGKLERKIPHHLHHYLFARTTRRTVPRVRTGEVANLRLVWLPAPPPKIPKELHRDLRPVLTRAVSILRARKLIPPNRRTLPTPQR